VSGSHRVVRWFRNNAQQLPRLVLLSSVRGIWCGLGGPSVRSTADPHRPALLHTHYADKACCAPTHTRTQHVRRTHTLHVHATRTPARSAYAYTHHLRQPAKRLNNIFICLVSVLTIELILCLRTDLDDCRWQCNRLTKAASRRRRGAPEARLAGPLNALQLAV
jgi:hypothetical protein